MKEIKNHFVALVLGVATLALVPMPTRGQSTVGERIIYPPEFSPLIASRPRPEQRSLVPPTKFVKVQNAIPNRYIVVLNDDVVPSDAPLDVRRAQITAIANSLAEAHLGKVGFVYETALKGFSVELPDESAAIALSENSQVKWVEEDGRGEWSAFQSNPSWGLDRIDQSGSVIVRGRGSIMAPEARVLNKETLSVQDARPLAKAIEILEAKYGWVITYEDPRYVHESEIADLTEAVRKDLDRFKTGEAPRVLVPRGGALDIDYDVVADTKLPVDRATVVQQLLDANAATGNAGKFRLETNGEIIHVTPTAIKNSAGALVPQESVLDAAITLTAEERTGMQTLEAICAAVSKATQTRVVVGTIPINLFLQHRDQQGAAAQKARDILVNTLKSTKNGSNLSWRLLYDPGMKMYALNIHSVSMKRVASETF